MTARQPARGLALDLDGTLMDSMHFHAEAWQRAFADAGLAVELEWFYLLEGVRGVEVIERTAARCDVALDSEARKRVYALKQQFFDEVYRPVPMAGASRLFSVIAELGYASAVVTGAERRVAEAALDALGVRQQVGFIVGGDEIQRGKPAPDPYLRALANLRLRADRCLVLENAPAGIESARAAGLTCVAVETTLPGHHLMRADYRVRHLEEFSDLLLREARLSGGAGPWQITRSAAS